MSQLGTERSNPTDIANHQNGLLLTDNRICHRVYTITVCPMAHEYNEDQLHAEHKGITLEKNETKDQINGHHDENKKR